MSMIYEEIYQEYQNALPYQPMFDLETQPRYAFVIGFSALLLLSLSLIVSKAFKNFALRSISFTIVSFSAALFTAMAAVLASNSFGVYV